MRVCNSSCLNQTWLGITPVWAYWAFENDFTDGTTLYNGTPTGSPTFTQGYVGRAVSFTPFSGQRITTNPRIPLANRTFSIDVWIYPTGLTNSIHHSICGMCSAGATDYCLHLTLAKNGTFFTLYFGLYADDVNSYSPAMTTGSWMHAAVTFDAPTKKVSVYRNGVLLRSAAVNNAFKGTTGSFSIGEIPGLAVANDTFQVHVC